MVWVDNFGTAYFAKREELEKTEPKELPSFLFLPPIELEVSSKDQNEKMKRRKKLNHLSLSVVS